MKSHVRIIVYLGSAMCCVAFIGMFLYKNYSQLSSPWTEKTREIMPLKGELKYNAKYIDGNIEYFSSMETQRFLSTSEIEKVGLMRRDRWGRDIRYFINTTTNAVVFGTNNLSLRIFVWSVGANGLDEHGYGDDVRSW